jgi:uncharacterized protein YecE (DUF72 family)
LHGRNAAGWYGDREKRYAYDYSPAELHAIGEIVGDLKRNSRKVHVFFNNNSTGAGTINAQQLAALLGISSSSPVKLPPRQATFLDLA